MDISNIDISNIDISNNEKEDVIIIIEENNYISSEPSDTDEEYDIFDSISGIDMININNLQIDDESILKLNKKRSNKKKQSKKRSKLNEKIIKTESENEIENELMKIYYKKLKNIDDVSESTDSIYSINSISVSSNDYSESNIREKRVDIDEEEIVESNIINDSDSNESMYEYELQNKKGNHIKYNNV